MVTYMTSSLQSRATKRNPSMCACVFMELGHFCMDHNVFSGICLVGCLCSPEYLFAPDRIKVSIYSFCKNPFQIVMPRCKGRTVSFSNCLLCCTLKCFKTKQRKEKKSSCATEQLFNSMFVTCSSDSSNSLHFFLLFSYSNVLSFPK